MQVSRENWAVGRSGGTGATQAPRSAKGQPGEGAWDGRGNKDGMGMSEWRVGEWGSRGCMRRSEWKDVSLEDMWRDGRLSRDGRRLYLKICSVRGGNVRNVAIKEENKNRQSRVIVTCYSSSIQCKIYQRQAMCSIQWTIQDEFKWLVLASTWSDGASS